MIDVDICMLVTNCMTHDARVLKEATSLANAGYKVLVLAVCGDKSLPAQETRNGFTIRRIFIQGISFSDRPLLKVKNFTLMTLRRLAFRYHQYLPKGAPLTHQMASLELWAGEKQHESVVAELVKAVLPEYRVKIFHAHDYDGLVIFDKAGITHPVVYDSHELFHDEIIYIGHDRSKERAREKQMAQRCIGHLVVSDMMADRLTETLDIPRPTVLHNAFDLRTAGNSAAIYDTTDRRKIVHSGSITYGRSLPELIDALQYIPDDIVLILMGDGPLRVPLLNQAKVLEVAHKVVHVPSVPTQSVAPTMAQADAGLVLTSHASTYNGVVALPNKFFESIAAGLPLINNSNEQMRIWVEKYDLGAICDATDPKSIAQAIMTALEPANNARYRQNVAKAREILNWEQEEKKLIGLYAQLMATDNNVSNGE